MLSGCPDCGHNTFQYIPEGADPEPVADSDAEPPEPPVDEDSVTGRVTRAASTVKEYVRSHEGREDRPTETREGATDSSGTDPDAATGRSTDAEGEDDAESTVREDRAQASARGEVADVSSLRSSAEPAPAEPADDSDPTGQEDSSGATSPPPGAREGKVVDEPESAVDADLEELREELNDQFESIRIVEPGQYELNLMELYDREEHIVALQEDGKYVIEVPESWRDGE
jgi:predicted  nucleic acid-binding Zn-ribbon protein